MQQKYKKMIQSVAKMLDLFLMLGYDISVAEMQRKEG